MNRYPQSFRTGHPGASRGLHPRAAKGIGLHARRTPAGFTLIEVLVVVAIIALLISILLPSLRSAREQTRLVVCETQLRELMHGALMYATTYKGRLPGVGRNDSTFKAEYDAGTRRDWLSWFGTYDVLINTNCKSWKNAPQGGRLWPYYKKAELLKCPSSENFNGKNSYSTPENVALAMKDKERRGIPPVVEAVKQPAFAIQFLDEDETSITNLSWDDGFGADDMFADRHRGKATVSFFDGHGESFYFARGQKTRYSENRTSQPFRAWMIEIAPFNSRYTPRPWAWRGDMTKWLKFKADANFPPDPCRADGPGCE